MAVRRIQEVPRDLPHAHLYLDDLEQIAKILLDAHKGPLAELKEAARITYSIGNSEMDSIDDLQVLGGSARKIKIKLGDRYADVSLEFYRFIKPTIALYGLPDGDRWAVYARIKSIFDQRQLQIKNVIEDLPGWLKVLSYSLVILFPNVVIPLGGLSLLTFCILVAYAVFFAFLTFTLFRSSRVFFVRSHEKVKISSAARRGYARDLIFLAIGALLGALANNTIKLLTDRFFNPPQQ
jgi:hypothetical protein